MGGYTCPPYFFVTYNIVIILFEINNMICLCQIANKNS